MVLSFDTAYRHISQYGFLQRDGFIIYQDAKRHFVGHEAKDVIHHHQNIQKFSPSPRLSFRADAVKLDDLFRRVEKVTHQPLTDIYKLAAFLTYFYKDGRPGIAIRIQTMMLMKATYAMTYKSVCDMTAFDDTPHHHALAIKKSTELCRKYGLVTCPYADAVVATSIVVKLVRCSSSPTLHHQQHLLRHGLLNRSRCTTPTRFRNAIALSLVQ